VKKELAILRDGKTSLAVKLAHCSRAQELVFSNLQGEEFSVLNGSDLDKIQKRQMIIDTLIYDR